MIGVKANAIPVYRYFTQQKYISFNFVYLYFSICSIQHHKNQKFYFTREAKVYTPPLGSLQHSFYQISITLRGWWWVMKEDARTDWFWIRAILVGVSWWEKTVVPFHHHQLILISPLFFFFFRFTNQRCCAFIYCVCPLTFSCIIPRWSINMSS